MGYLNSVVPRLDGRTGVVTGAGSGMGAAISRGMAEAGANVVLVDRNAEGLERTAEAISADGGSFLSITADLIDADTPETVVSQTMDRFGSLDILVHAAAVVHDPCPFDELSFEDLEFVYGVNLRGAFVLSQAAMQHLEPNGAILFFGSLTAHMGFPNIAGYSMTKGAVVGLARALAVELAPRGVRVNVLSPGATETPINLPYWTDDYRAALKARTPVGRIATPDEIAGPALFLVSDASRHIFGQTLVVDGGYLVQGDAFPRDGSYLEE